MNTNEIRSLHQLTGKQIRRARRLYHRLCYSQIMLDASLNCLVLKNAAKRAQEAGLYSDGTVLKDIEWSFLRKCWKLAWKDGYNDTFGWFRWLKDTGFSGYRKTGIRIVNEHQKAA